MTWAFKTKIIALLCIAILDAGVIVHLLSTLIPVYLPYPPVNLIAYTTGKDQKVSENNEHTHKTRRHTHTHTHTTPSPSVVPPLCQHVLQGWLMAQGSCPLAQAAGALSVGACTHTYPGPSIYSALCT